MFNYNRWLAKKRLIKRYKYLLEVDALMEEFITYRIMQGGDPTVINKHRQELVNKQAEIKEQKKLLDFLSKTK